VRAELSVEAVGAGRSVPSHRWGAERRPARGRESHRWASEVEAPRRRKVGARDGASRRRVESRIGRVQCVCRPFEELVSRARCKVKEGRERAAERASSTRPRTPPPAYSPPHGPSKSTSTSLTLLARCSLKSRLEGVHAAESVGPAASDERAQARSRTSASHCYCTAHELVARGSTPPTRAASSSGRGSNAKPSCEPTWLGLLVANTPHGPCAAYRGSRTVRGPGRGRSPSDRRGQRCSLDDRSKRERVKERSRPSQVARPARSPSRGASAFSSFPDMLQAAICSHQASFRDASERSKSSSSPSTSPPLASTFRSSCSSRRTTRACSWPWLSRREKERGKARNHDE